MSENGKCELLQHSTHDHPLILTQTDVNRRCYGCWEYMFSGETIYRCSVKWCWMFLHEACAEMPREITHALHPQHSLIQQRVDSDSYPTCAVCENLVRVIAYFCSSPDPCDFQIHVKCAHSMDMMGAPSYTKHPSHPQHDLKLLWRPGRGASIRCDACGVIHRGNSNICTVCHYCINESCAALGPTTNRLLHDHPLSLAYRLPLEL